MQVAYNEPDKKFTEKKIENVWIFYVFRQKKINPANFLHFVSSNSHLYAASKFPKISFIILIYDHPTKKGKFNCCCDPNCITSLSFVFSWFYCSIWSVLMLNQPKIIEKKLEFYSLIQRCSAYIRGCEACGKPKCSWCKGINKTTTFTSSNNNKTFKIFHSVNCQSSWVTVEPR